MGNIIESVKTFFKNIFSKFNQHVDEYGIAVKEEYEKLEETIEEQVDEFKEDVQQLREDVKVNIEELRSKTKAQIEKFAREVYEVELDMRKTKDNMLKDLQEAIENLKG